MSTLACLKFVLLDVITEETKRSHPATSFLQNRAYRAVASQGQGTEVISVITLGMIS